MKEHVTHTELYKGYKIDIFPDQDAENPRTEYDNVGTMICWHSRYNLGDKHGYKDPRDFMETLASETTKNVEEMDDGRLQKIVERNYILMPLNLYDHSGITMSTNTFSCPWDSGQVGWIYCSKKRAKEEWGNSHKNRHLKQARKYLESEVQTYDNYLTGNVYGFVVSKNISEPGTDEDEIQWEEIDSCWGFNADYLSEDWKYLLGEARSSIDHDESKSLPLLAGAGLLIPDGDPTPSQSPR